MKFHPGSNILVMGNLETKDLGDLGDPGTGVFSQPGVENSNATPYRFLSFLPIRNEAGLRANVVV